MGKYSFNANKRAYLKSNYGLSLEAYQSMVSAQGNKCKICMGPEKNGKLLAVDHDHETGVVRGLLCSRCNMMLGMAKDNIALLCSAITYLENARCVA